MSTNTSQGKRKWRPAPGPLSNVSVRSSSSRTLTLPPPTEADLALLASMTQEWTFAADLGEPFGLDARRTGRALGRLRAAGLVECERVRGTARHGWRPLL